MKKLILALALCSCGTISRTQYGLQLDACIDGAHTKAEADACLAKVRLAWDEAGAAPALVFDGGDQ